MIRRQKQNSLLDLFRVSSKATPASLCSPSAFLSISPACRTSPIAFSANFLDQRHRSTLPRRCYFSSTVSYSSLNFALLDHLATTIVESQRFVSSHSASPDIEEGSSSSSLNLFRHVDLRVLLRGSLRKLTLKRLEDVIANDSQFFTSLRHLAQQRTKEQSSSPFSDLSSTTLRHLKAAAFLPGGELCDDKCFPSSICDAITSNDDFLEFKKKVNLHEECINQLRSRRIRSVFHWQNVRSKPLNWITLSQRELIESVSPAEDDVVESTEAFLRDHLLSFDHRVQSLFHNPNFFKNVLAGKWFTPKSSPTMEEVIDDPSFWTSSSVQLHGAQFKDNPQRREAFLADVKGLKAVHFLINYGPTASALRVTESKPADHKQLGGLYLFNMLQDHPNVQEFRRTNRAAQICDMFDEQPPRSASDWLLYTDVSKLTDAERMIFNEECQALLERALLGEAELTKFAKMINAQSIVKLTPGASHCHSVVPPFGCRSRDDLFQRMNGYLRRLSIGSTKEYLSILSVISLPRQGKTSLFDAVGHHPGLMRAWTADGKRSTFIFNLTFNAQWAVDKEFPKMLKKNRDGETPMTPVEVAQHLLCVRLLAAGAGVFEKHPMSSCPFSEEAAFVAKLFRNDIDDVVSFVERAVCHAAALDVGDCCFIYLLDEFTKVTDAIVAASSPTESEKNSRLFVSSVFSLVASKRAIMINGFNHINEALSLSGRAPATSLELTPLSSARSRRSMHVLKARFHNLVSTLFGTLNARDSLRIFEMTKSSGGLFGTAIEALQNRWLEQETNDGDDPRSSKVQSHEISIFDVLVKRIPALSKLKSSDPSNFSSQQLYLCYAVRVLQWKAASACVSFEQLRRVEGYATMDQPRAIPELLTDLQEADRHSTAHVPLGNPLDNFDYLVYHARVEPLFVSSIDSTKLTSTKAEASNLFRLYGNDMLQQFSEAMLQLNDSAVSVRRRFGLLAPPALASDNAPALPSPTPNATSEDSAAAARSSQPISTDSQPLTPGDIRGAFFADAVSFGIIFQRHLRRQLLDRLPFFKQTLQTNHTTLDVFLKGAKVMKTMFRGASPPSPRSLDFILIDWTASAVSASTAAAAASDSLPHLREFSGRYPHHSEKTGRRLSLAPSDFNTHSVLVPKRGAPGSTGSKEDNPVADIIFHEAVKKTDYGDNNSNSSATTLAPGDVPLELVQFWVDTKHRMMGKSLFNDGFAKRVGKALRNPHLRRTRGGGGGGLDPDKKVRHIVHVIICPFLGSEQDLQESIHRLGRNEHLQQLPKDSILDSYSLVLVDPDQNLQQFDGSFGVPSLSFTNLVSQPVALTVPLLEDQFVSSWTEKLFDTAYSKKSNSKNESSPAQTASSPSELLWNYRATKTDPLVPSHFLDDEHENVKATALFSEWRSLIFDEDIDRGIGHVFYKSKAEFLAAVADEGSAPHQNDDKSLLLSFAALPFATVLEALRLLPTRFYGGNYVVRFGNTAVTHFSSSVDLRLMDFRLPPVDDAEKPKKTEAAAARIRISARRNNDANDTSITVPLECVLANIKVGHVVRYGFPTPAASPTTDSTGKTTKKNARKSEDEFRLFGYRYSNVRGMRNTPDGVWTTFFSSGAIDDNTAPVPERAKIAAAQLWNMSLLEMLRWWCPDLVKKCKDQQCTGSRDGNGQLASTTAGAANAEHEARHQQLPLSAAYDAIESCVTAADSNNNNNIIKTTVDADIRQQQQLFLQNPILMCEVECAIHTIATALCKSASGSIRGSFGSGDVDHDDDDSG